MTEEVSGSEWNGATLTNQRIHDLFVRLTECFMNRDLSNWIITLETLNQELYGFQKTDEKEQYRKELEDLSSKINKQVSMQHNKHIKNKSIPFELIRQLQDMRYKLQVIFHRSGLQTQLKEDAGDAF